MKLQRTDHNTAKAVTTSQLKPFALSLSDALADFIGFCFSSLLRLAKKDKNSLMTVTAHMEGDIFVCRDKYRLKYLTRATRHLDNTYFSTILAHEIHQ